MTELEAFDDSDDRRAWADQVFAAIRQLSPTQAKIIEFVYLDGHTQNEASTAFGISPADVAHFVAQALRTLSVTAISSPITAAVPAPLRAETA